MGSTQPVSLSMAGLSPAVVCHLMSPAKNALMECMEFLETFHVLHPEGEPGNRVVDLYLHHIVHHLSPWISDNHYDDYIKGLDAVLDTIHADMLCIYMASDASTPPKGDLQAMLASLVFWGRTKVAHIVAVGGQAMAPNAELMMLEMLVATVIAAGC